VLINDMRAVGVGDGVEDGVEPLSARRGFG
jgi:hypothetical protein